LATRAELQQTWSALRAARQLDRPAVGRIEVIDDIGDDDGPTQQQRVSAGTG
jgi:hypothetical protein